MNIVVSRGAVVVLDGVRPNLGPCRRLFDVPLSVRRHVTCRQPKPVVMLQQLVGVRHPLLDDDVTAVNKYFLFYLYSMIID